MPARTCEICEERTAAYLCQNCGTAVCPACLVGWLCKKCSRDEVEATEEPWKPVRIGPIPLPVIAVGVMLAGFFLVFIGSNTGSGSGGCFIWPLPFVVGCGFGAEEALPIVALSLLVIVFLFVSVLALSRKWAGPIPDAS